MIRNMLRSIFSGRVAARAACLAALSLVLAASSFAQIVQGGFIFPRSDATVVIPELSRHLPASGVRKQTRYMGGLRWETTHTLSVMSETRLGLASKTWKSDTRTWTDWVYHGNPIGAPIQRISGSGDSPGVDTGLTMIPGFSATGNDFIVYQGVGLPPTQPTVEVDFKSGIHQIDPVAKTLVPGITIPSFSTVLSPALPTSFLHFNPQAFTTSPSPIGSTRTVRHVFGTGVPRGHARSTRFVGATIPLVELRREHDSAFPQFFNHGVPTGATGVAVGPGSATSIIHNYLSAPLAVDREEQRYVFASTNPAQDGYGEGLNGDQVAYFRTHSGGARWHSLGSPGGLVYGAPLAIPYYTNIPIAGGLGRLVVFAVANTGNNSYALKSRYHDGNSWDTQWQHWGAPAIGGDKFKLTSSVVYWNGTPNQMANLRISAFGYSEETSSRRGQLIEFEWDGASWRFAAPRMAPDGESFRTTHSSVIEQGTLDRIVVVGRTTTGRIYEFAREIQSGQVISETWTDLSWGPVIYIAVGP